MLDLSRSVRLAFRSLRASTTTSLAAILVIALGTGATTAVLAAVWGALLRPLPWADAEELVIFSIALPDGSEFGFGPDRLDDWGRHLPSAEAVVPFATGEVAVRGAGEPRMAEIGWVGERFFEVLGTDGRQAAPAPRLGPGTVVLSERLSRELGLPGPGDRHGHGEEVLPALRFGPRPGPTSTAVGAAPISVPIATPIATVASGFDFPSAHTEAWLPIPPEPPPSTTFRLLVRLADGATLERLRTEALAAMRLRIGPEVGGDGESRPLLVPVRESLLGEVRPLARAALGAAVLVLLVTCGNVAMLLLGRSARRRREQAVRLALGARPGDLLRSSLLECSLLSIAGTALGAWLAWLGLRLASGPLAEVSARWQGVSLDGPILLAQPAIVLAVTLACGAAPALFARRESATQALRGGSSLGPRQHGWLAVVVVAQIAVSVTLVTGSILLARTVYHLIDDGLEIDPRQVLVVDLERGDAGARLGAVGDPGLLDHPGLFAGQTFGRRVLEQVRAVPGVVEAGIGSALPPRALPFGIFVSWRTDDRRDHQRLAVVSITPGYLEALGMAPLRGRGLRASDDRATAAAIAISESADRFYSPEESLVGRPLVHPLPPIARFQGAPVVVAVMPDTKYDGLDQPAAATLYLPWSARPTDTAHLAVRTAGDPHALVPILGQILRAADPDMPISEIRTLEQERSASIADRRSRVAPAVGLAAIALGVTLCGIFALFARGVTERRREMAVRMAIGATDTDVLGLVLRRAAGLTLLGLLAGLLGNLALAGSLSSLLVGVGPFDPFTYLAVAALVLLSGLAAAWLPARRAAGIEPVELLRAD